MEDNYLQKGCLVENYQLYLTVFPVQEQNHEQTNILIYEENL